MSCTYEDDQFVFQLDNIKCVIATKDEDGNTLRPNGNLSKFYEELRNQFHCEMEFDSKNNILLITYDKCDYFSHYKDVCNCDRKVTFSSGNTTISLPHELCFDAICNFLKQFRFVI